MITSVNEVLVSLKLIWNWLPANPALFPKIVPGINPLLLSIGASWASNCSLPIWKPLAKIQPIILWFLALVKIEDAISISKPLETVIGSKFLRLVVDNPGG